MPAARLAIPAVVLVLLGAWPELASGTTMTCGELKTYHTDEGCTANNPAKVLSKTPGEARCPYSFAKPACKDAEPQAPRDLSTGATGKMTPKATALNEKQTEFLPLTNVHFHLGAEHKSDEYADATDSLAYDSRRLGDGRRLANDVRPGFMCSAKSLTDAQLKPYTFQYCKGAVEVGKSYEVHYVHSSAGYTKAEVEGVSDMDAMDDGLGGAANGRGLLNPMIAVQGQVYQIVNGVAEVDDLLHGWTVLDHSNSVMYTGSTTGQSHNNQVCSPYVITWHVDKSCHQVSPASFDKMCKDMEEMYKLEQDLYPHGSRKLVASDYVVKAEFVEPLK